jgi:hypothetical protein
LDRIPPGSGFSKQKVGLINNPWLAYRLGESLVIKTFDFQREDVNASDFPDLGSNVEVYFDTYMLELEGLSPWTELRPGEKVSHTEKLQVLAVTLVESRKSNRAGKKLYHFRV